MSYATDPHLLALLRSHSDDLQKTYSRLKPFRMDFFFQRDTALDHQRRDDWLSCEMHRLAEYALHELDGIVGYAWVQEFTPRHGIHYHAVFYLNAQHYRMPGKFIDALTDWWRCFTNGDGWFYDGSKRQSYHTFDGQRVLHYDDKTQQAQLQRALGYLAKKEQKDYRNYCFGLSDVPAPNGRGRPRKQ